MHHLLFLILAVIWGSNFMLMQEASEAFGPVSIAGGRVIGGGAVLAMLWWMSKKGWPFKRGDIVPLLMVAFIGYIWPYTVLPYLIGRFGETGFFAMSVVFVPLVTVIVSIPLLGVKPTWRQTIGVIGGLGFLTLLADDGTDHRQLPLWAVALAMTVPVCYALANTYVKRRFTHGTPTSIACMCLIISAVVLLPLGFGTEPVKHESAQFSRAAGALLFFAVVGTGVSTLIFYRLLIDRGPLYAGMVAYLVPVVAMAWGWLRDEDVTSRQLIAFAGLLVMTALVQFERRQRKVITTAGVISESPATDPASSVATVAQENASLPDGSDACKVE